MIEAVKIWNEPNNKSHWDLELDPGWTRFAEMAKLACAAVRAESAGLTRVLGGISPIDPAFIQRLATAGVLDGVDAVAVHGFPLDWNHWPIHEWPDKIAEIADHAFENLIAKAAFAATRARSMGKIAAAFDDFGFRQILWIADAFGGIGQVFAGSKHDKVLHDQ